MLDGMPVVHAGERVGRVLSVHLTPDMRAMETLAIDCGLRGRRFVPARNVQMLGDVAVLVDALPSRVHAPCPSFPRRAVSPEGAHIGCITGAWLEETTRDVDSLELSQSMPEDLLCGRSRVHNFLVRRDSGEIVICPEGGISP